MQARVLGTPKVLIRRSTTPTKLMPRLRLWSKNDPITLLGAFGVQKSGRDELVATSRWVASRFSNCQAYEFDLFAAGASGDLAYTVGFEKVTASTDGGPVEPFCRTGHSWLPTRGRGVVNRAQAW